MGVKSAVVITVIFSIFKYIPEIECAIQCYKCLLAPPTYYTKDTIRLCKNFDYSDEFIVDCPHSTFCMKKITSANIPNAINGTERDCAHQKLTTQNYYDGKWHEEVTVEEPYVEGCAKVNDKGARTLSIEHCYCKGDLCNSSRTTYPAETWSYLLLVIASLRWCCLPA